MEKLLFVPFSCVICLLLRYYDHFNFLVCKSVFRGLSKDLVISTALHHYLVLLPTTFTQNFTSFEFSDFRLLLERNEQLGKKSWIAENFFSYMGLNTVCFEVLEKTLEYRGRPWTETFFKFIGKLVFVAFSWVIYVLFRHYVPFIFLVSQSVSCRLAKNLLVTGAQHHCLVLLPYF